MELSKIKNGFYILISLSVGMLLLLGSWWLYLVFKLSNKLEELHSPAVGGNLIRMIKWEGATFLILLCTLAIGLVLIFIQDHKKTKALQDFFSSLTHELKTPLASIKLQAEVLIDIFSNLQITSLESEKVNKYLKRLGDDSLKLEDQLDSHLQLARIERGAPVNLRTINLGQFLKQESLRYSHLINLNCDEDQLKHINILADDFALQTVFRNLFENSIKHGTSHIKAKPVNIKTSYSKKKTIVEVHYWEDDNFFLGEAEKLTTLFYKHNSPQGTGIGLYIIKKLQEQMNGRLRIEIEPTLKFILEFSTTNEEL